MTIHYRWQPFEAPLDPGKPDYERRIWQWGNLWRRRAREARLLAEEYYGGGADYEWYLALSEMP